MTYLDFDLSNEAQAKDAADRFHIRCPAGIRTNIVSIHPDADPVDLLIRCEGEGNHLVIGPRCRVWGEMTCNGSGSTVIVHGETHAMNIRATTYESSTLEVHSGVVAYGLRVWVSSQSSLTIGSGSQLSEGVTIRTSDHHTLFDLDSLETLNPPQDVAIQPCVWIGQDVTIMKGVSIGAGSIVGARALVNTSIPATELWAGSPARMIRRRVSWAVPLPATADQLRERRDRIAAMTGAGSPPAKGRGDRRP